MATTIYGQPVAITINKASTVRGWQTLFGLKYPLTKNLSRGYFSKESGEALIINNLHQLLLTERGERVMLPDFGANLKRFLFQPLDQQLYTAVKEEVLHAINRYAPGVVVRKLSVLPLDGFGEEGLQRLQVKLIVGIREDVDTSTEVIVKVG